MDQEKEQHIQPVAAVAVEPVAAVAVEPVERFEVEKRGLLTLDIPDRFFKILSCCAITCLNFESCADCWGCKGYFKCICCNEEGICCKISGDDEPASCMACWSGFVECVFPTLSVLCFQQICCCECLFAPCCDVESSYRNVSGAASIDSHSSDAGDAVICNGCFCCLSNCYCKLPQCLGCYNKGACLCIDCENVQCKPMCCSADPSRPELLCTWNKGNCRCIYPTTCCKGISQCFCMDDRYAFPCDSEVPCVLTLLPFCACCPNMAPTCKCCPTINGLSVKTQQPQPAQQQQVYQGQPGQQQQMYQGQPGQQQPVYQGQPVQMYQGQPGQQQPVYQGQPGPQASAPPIAPPTM